MSINNRIYIDNKNKDLKAYSVKYGKDLKVTHIKSNAENKEQSKK